jgi:cation:H+ antiporter
MDIILLLAGFIGLVIGGDLLVRGAVSVARNYGISPMVIGLTLVGFGTSTPELVTSLQAAFAGSPGIAIGNVVGSNTANILLILGLTALIAPITVQPETFRRDGLVLALATAACLAIALTGDIGRLAGFSLAVALGAYLAFTFRMDRAAQQRNSAEWAGVPDSLPEDSFGIWRAAAIFVFGLLLTVGAARLLVTGAISLAADLGVSEAVIGVTIVAIGTSMPELITSVMAARKQQPDIAFGNIIGSNIFNIFGILGVTALVHPLPVPDEIMDLDIWVMVLAAVSLILAAWSGWRITRREGLAMLAAYCAYLGWLAYSAV